MMLRVCLVFGILASFSGCGGETTKPLPKTAPVTGKITLNGSPASSAMVTFIPTGATKGIECQAVTDPDGTYELKQIRGQAGAPPGDYKVIVNLYVTRDGKPVVLDGEEAPANLGAVEALPSRYSNANESQLLAKVPDAGGNFDFDLASP